MSDFKINKYLRKPNRRVSRTVTSDTTLQNGDSGGVVIIDSSSNDVTITIPSDTNESFADGTVIWLYRDGTNFAILRGESGVTLNPDKGYIQSDKTEIYIRKQAANEWVVGDLGGYQTSVVATGGTVSDITVNGVDYRVHEFTTVGTSTFEVELGGEVEYLVVAGGGASSGGANGSDSSFGPITSIGGGAGEGGAGVGNSGGSGGGAGGRDGSRPGGSGTNGQGFDGGAGAGTSGAATNRAGGGGGAGEAGTLGPVESGIGRGGDGGDGIESNITGTLTYRAGGGCGTGHAIRSGRPGTPGLGGGGAKGQSGAPNTGGGGGGTASERGGGGAGGYRSSVLDELSGQNSTAEFPFVVTSSQSYSVVVGAGGNGITNGGSGIVIIRYQI